MASTSYNVQDMFANSVTKGSKIGQNNMRAVQMSNGYVYIANAAGVPVDGQGNPTTLAASIKAYNDSGSTSPTTAGGGVGMNGAPGSVSGGFVSGANPAPVAAAAPAAAAPAAAAPAAAPTPSYMVGSGGLGIGVQNAFGIRKLADGPAGSGYITLANNKGDQLNVDQAGNYFQIVNGQHIPVTDSRAVSLGFNSANPEVNAQKQMAQIDPKTEALRQQLAASYAPQLAEAESFAANPGKLDPSELREVQQSARMASEARGNSLGAAQAAQEAMETGSASIMLRNQQQAYLTNVKNLAQSYLGSGQTPGQASSAYVNNAQNQASAAAQGSPVYQPGAAQPAPYTYINPDAGANFAQGTQGFMAQGVGATMGGAPSKTTAQLTGAATGALSGAAAGTMVYPGIGTAVGAVVGGAAGYFGAGCWVARECLGTESSDWRLFRDWMFNRAPKWFKWLYMTFGENFAYWIHSKPRLKKLIKTWMLKVIRADQAKLTWSFAGRH